MQQAGVLVNPTKKGPKAWVPLNLRFGKVRLQNQPCQSITGQRNRRLDPHNKFIMGREEQIEEREVLDSIFPEEITGAIEALSRL